MSETVHYRGKAIKLVQGFKEVEEKAEQILNNKGVSTNTHYTTHFEQLCQDFYKDYFYHPKTEILYEIYYTEHDLDDEIILAKETDAPGEIDFELRYYNGGAGFEECLEEAFDKLYRQK